MKKNIIAKIMILATVFSCSTKNDYTKTVEKVDLDKFFKKWYVIAGRTTFLETGAHNSVEEYRYDADSKTIDINFYCNKDSFTGPLKKVPQTGRIKNSETNAHWEISPFWPLQFDYLIIALAEDYSWTVVGVPSKRYVWIMSDQWKMSDEQLAKIVQQVEALGYPVNDIMRVPQQWDK